MKFTPIFIYPAKILNFAILALKPITVEIYGFLLSCTHVSSIYPILISLIYAMARTLHPYLSLYPVDYFVLHFYNS